MITLGQNLLIMNNTQHPFFTTDNNGFNFRSLCDYYEREINDEHAFHPDWHYFRFVDDNTIIFEPFETLGYAQWTSLIKIKRDNNGVWSHSQADAVVSGDDTIPPHDPEPYITSTDPDWNTL